MPRKTKDTSMTETTEQSPLRQRPKRKSPEVEEDVSSLKPTAAKISTPSKTQHQPKMKQQKNRKKQKDENPIGQLKTDNQDDTNNSRILQVFSSMFRQHANLYLQEAAVLEKMAQYPLDPHLWFEPSSSVVDSCTLESIDNRILRDNVYKLAKKSFDCMEEMQKEMDALQDLVECAMQQESEQDDNQSDGTVESMDVLDLHGEGKTASMRVLQEEEEASVSSHHPYESQRIFYTSHTTETGNSHSSAYRSRERDELDSDDEMPIVFI